MGGWLLLAAGGFSACRGSDGSNTSRGTALAPAPPPPRDLVAELFVPHPKQLWESFRSLAGPVTQLLPSAPELALASLWGLDPLAAASLDLSVPLFGVVTLPPGSPPLLVLGVHLESGPEFVAKLTTGAAPSHRLTRAEPLLLLAPTKASGGAPGERTLAVIDNTLLVGPEGALSTSGSYLAGTLSRKRLLPAPLSLVVNSNGVRSLGQSLRLLWKAQQDGLLASQRAALARQGRPADFGDPETVLRAADATAEGLLAVLESAQELRVELARLEDPIQLELRLVPAPEGAAQELSAQLSRGSTLPLAALSAETAFAILLRRTGGEPRAQGVLRGLEALAGPGLATKDRAQLTRALEALEAGRGSHHLFAMYADQTLLWVGDVQDEKLFRSGLSQALALLERPPFVDPLSAILGRPSVSSPRQALAGLLDDVRQTRIEFVPSVEQRRSGLRPRSMRVLARVGADGFVVAAGSDPEEAFRATLLAARKPDPALRAAVLAGLGAGVSSAAFVDAARLGLVPQPTSALFAAALGSSNGAVVVRGSLAAAGVRALLSRGFSP